MPHEKSKQEQEEGWDLAAYGAAYEADRPTSSFPQCRLTVCTAYLQVEIYSHIETPLSLFNKNLFESEC